MRKEHCDILQLLRTSTSESKCSRIPGIGTLLITFVVKLHKKLKLFDAHAMATLSRISVWNATQEGWVCFSWLVTLNLFFIRFFLFAIGSSWAPGTLVKHFPTKAKKVFLLSQVILVVYHLQGQTGWSTVYANGKESPPKWEIPFEISMYHLCDLSNLHRVWN